MPDNLGSQADPAVTDSTADATITAALKGLLSVLAGTLTVEGTIDATGQGDVPITLDSEVVAVDATGQGDVPITLDSEVVAVDATGQGDVPVTLDGETVQLAAGSNLVGKVQPFAAIAETGSIALIGPNQQVDQNDYGASASLALGGTYSGEILSAVFFSGESGTGAVQRPAGKLLLLDTDPSVSAGATTLGADYWPAVLGIIDVDTDDWPGTDTSGSAACIVAQPIPFHALSTLYVVWFHEDATSFNDAAGDDETLRVNLWYRRDS